MKRVWVLLGLALLVRFIGIRYGLPAVFNSDEPHLVNVAVSFGGGSLNPHFFKYPTLWMYLLFGCYGLFFLFWSGFGLLHSVQQFGQLFVWNPTVFYLIGRLLSVAFSVAAIDRVWRTGRLWWGERGGLWAAAFLAVSPVLVMEAHSSKPDSFMFFLSAWAWWFAARYLSKERPRDLVLCGLMVGLAGSAQFTALPLASLVAAAWASHPREWKPAVWALFAAAAGFIIGSPFILLAHQEVWRMVQDTRTMLMWGAVNTPHAVWKAVLTNMAQFGGGVLISGIPLFAGSVFLSVRENKRELMLFIPILAYFICLSRSSDGAWPRYLFAIFPALALMAARGVEGIIDKLTRRGPSFAEHPLFTATVLIFLMLPGARIDAGYDRELLLPDTRTISADWIERHIPQNSKILMDQEHASPRLKLCPAMLDLLIKQCEATGNSRLKYYQLMRSGHPGGGYFLYQIWRDPRDLHTLPGYEALSVQGRAVLDVRSGLAVAKKAGINYVVLSSVGANSVNSPELRDFLDQTEREGQLLAEFLPERNRRTGPVIHVYRIDRS